MAARPGSQIRLREGGSVEALDGAVDDSFLCQVCLDVFVEPTSGCPQAHACCRICYESVLASEQKKCPTCRHPTSTANLVRLRPLEDLLNKTLVRCKHAEAGEEDGAARNGEQGKVNKQPPRACKRAKISASAAGPAGLQEEGGAGGGAVVDWEAGEADGGCKWTGRLREVEAHLKSSCSFELLPCPFSAQPEDALFNKTFRTEDEFCREFFVRRELEKHAAECGYRKVDCPHCSNKVRVNELEDHEEDCDEREVECRNTGCSVIMTQGDIEEHSYGGECPLEKIDCPCHGCEAKVLRGDLQDHLAAFAGMHMLGLIKQNKELVNQQKQTELRMKQQVGLVAFQWTIARGWGGDRGSDVCSQSVRCGQFNICLVFSKLEQTGARVERFPREQRFSFGVQVDTDVTLDADAEIMVVGAGLQVPWKQGRNVLSSQRPPFYGYRGTPFSPTAEDTAKSTRGDGAILVEVRVWLFSVARGRESILQRVSHA